MLTTYEFLVWTFNYAADTLHQLCQCLSGGSYTTPLALSQLADSGICLHRDAIIFADVAFPRLSRRSGATEEFEDQTDSLRRNCEGSVGGSREPEVGRTGERVGTLVRFLR